MYFVACFARNYLGIKHVFDNLQENIRKRSLGTVLTFTKSCSNNTICCVLLFSHILNFVPLGRTESLNTLSKTKNTWWYCNGGGTQAWFWQGCTTWNLKVDPYIYQFLKKKWPIHIPISQILTKITQFVFKFS